MSLRTCTAVSLVVAVTLLPLSACSSGGSKPAGDQTVSPEEAAQAVPVMVGTPLTRTLPVQILPAATGTAALSPNGQSGLSNYQVQLFNCAGKVQGLVAAESNLSGGPILEAERVLRADPGNGVALAQIGQAVQPMRDLDQQVQAAGCDASVADYLQLVKAFSSDELQSLVLLNDGLGDHTPRGQQSLQQSSQLTQDAVDVERRLTSLLQGDLPPTPQH